MNPILFVLTLIMITLRPFFSEAVLPVVFFYYEMVFLVLVILHLILNQRTKELLRHPLFKVWRAWILLSGISFFSHLHGRLDVREWIPFTLGGMFFLISGTYAVDLRKRQWLMSALLTAALATLVLANVQWNIDFHYLKTHLDELVSSASDKSYLNDFLGRGRILGPFFSPDLFASYLLMIFFVSIVFWKEFKKRILLSIPIVLLVALFLTRSIGGWLSLLVGLTMLAVSLGKERRRKVWILVWLLVMTGLFLWVQRAGVPSEAASLENSVIQRLNFWKSAWEMFCYSPIWGVGFEQFSKVYGYFQQTGAFETWYAHNIVLQLLAEFGILGGAWFFYWLATFLKVTRGSDKFLRTALIVFFIHNGVDFSFSIPQVSDHWWIIAGLLVGDRVSQLNRLTRKHIMSHLVSVVIPHWSLPGNPAGRQALANCMNSVFQQTYPFLEVMVVNNEGRGAWVEEVERRYPKARWIHNLENRLFTGAMNQGIAVAKGEYILALNNDVVLCDNFIERLLKVIQTQNEIGMACGLLLTLKFSPQPISNRERELYSIPSPTFGGKGEGEEYMGEIIDSAGQFLSFAKTPRERGHGEKFRGQYQEIEEVFSVPGACGLYRKEMLESIKLSEGGYFDGTFGLFYEDLELAWRAREKGWKASFIPQAVAYHARGLTTKSSAPRWPWLGRFHAASLSEEHLERLIRNRAATLRRHCTWLEWLSHWPWILSYDLGLYFLRFILSL